MPQSLTGQTVTDPAEFIRLIPPGKRLLGLDLGTKTIGVALSDVTCTIASSYETIARTKFKADSACLLEIAREQDVGGLVLGLPRNLDGSEGPRAQATRAFARNFNQVSSLPILLWDERWSTMAAERMLIAADSSRKRRGEVIDKVAATIILQSALDRMKGLPHQSKMRPA